MRDDRRFPHTRIPNFIYDPDRYPDMTASHLATYGAAKSFAYSSTRSGKFGKCMAARETIARRARQSVATVKRNLKDFEAWGLLYRAGRDERYKRTVVRVFVDFPETFERTVKEKGVERAKADEMARLDSIRDEARAKAAKNADAGHYRPPKNKRPYEPETYPIPRYVPFAERERESSETGMRVKSDRDMGHVEPLKNTALEEHLSKNTLPSGAALIESDHSNNNGKGLSERKGQDGDLPPSEAESFAPLSLRPRLVPCDMTDTEREARRQLLKAQADQLAIEYEREKREREASRRDVEVVS